MTNEPLQGTLKHTQTTHAMQVLRAAQAAQAQVQARPAGRQKSALVRREGHPSPSRIPRQHVARPMTVQMPTATSPPRSPGTARALVLPAAVLSPLSPCRAGVPWGASPLQDMGDGEDGAGETNEEEMEAEYGDEGGTAAQGACGRCQRSDYCSRPFNHSGRCNHKLAPGAGHPDRGTSRLTPSPHARLRQLCCLAAGAPFASQYGSLLAALSPGLDSRAVPCPAPVAFHFGSLAIRRDRPALPRLGASQIRLHGQRVLLAQATSSTAAVAHATTSWMARTSARPITSRSHCGSKP